MPVTSRGTTSAVPGDKRLPPEVGSSRPKPSNETLSWTTIPWERKKCPFAASLAWRFPD
jgi:hypothetical protein